MRIIYILIAILFCQLSYSQNFTKTDSLRGYLNQYRSCYDVIQYDLDIMLNFSTKSISGSNSILFDVINDFSRIQIDLFENMSIDSIIYEGLKLDFERELNAVYIGFPWKILKGSTEQIEVYYHGQPRKAVNPPWDGGFSWEKDLKGHSWLGVSCEGVGASLWWPCKDHLSDEPKRMTIAMTVPAQLMGISNGRLIDVRNVNRNYTKYTWEVKSPINNYNVTLNVGNYKRIHDEYISDLDQKLDLDYYVLEENVDTARKHFKQVRNVIRVFEKYFGPYPFYEDSYKLVESSYWGMEHQSCIAYGNHFKNNDWDFDFIILHETAHEWFGNSLSCTDHAEMWLHEAFATYAEALYVEDVQDYFESVKYLLTKKSSIKKEYPILGYMDVNYDWKDSDIYTKGAWMLHTLRSVINNDEIWFDIIRTFCSKYYKSGVKTDDFIQVVNQKTGKDFGYFFRQYLEKVDYPKLQYKLIKGKKGKYSLEYRWVNVGTDFKMPVQISYNNSEYEWLEVTSQWQSKSIRKTSAGSIKPATHLFLIDYELIK